MGDSVASLAIKRMERSMEYVRPTCL